MKQLIIKTDDSRNRKLDEINQLSPGRLYIWGDGFYSRSIREYFRQNGYSGEISVIIDDEYYNSKESDAFSFSDYLKCGDKRIPVVFGFYNYPEIQKKKAMWHDIIPHMYDFHFAVINGKILPWNISIAKAKENAYRRSYELLSDGRSRNVMQRYLNAAIAGEFHELFSECYEERAYFNRITEGIKIDTLIDCGAFDGDSIHDFVLAHQEYRRIVAIEPDPLNVQKLYERESRESIRDLNVVQKGLGEKAGKLRFSVNGDSNSFLNDEGEEIIDITTLDDITGEQDLGTIFLKMDIEGSELDALYGAKRLIQERHPAMAICVYHKEGDLIEIPQYIHELVGAGVYDYFLGFHGLDLAELVFYAVSRETGEWHKIRRDVW